jgi:hypothetical protein
METILLAWPSDSRIAGDGNNEKWVTGMMKMERTFVTEKPSGLAVCSNVFTFGRV